MNSIITDFPTKLPLNTSVIFKGSRLHFTFSEFLRFIKCFAKMTKMDEMFTVHCHVNKLSMKWKTCISKELNDYFHVFLQSGVAMTDKWCFLVQKMSVMWLPSLGRESQEVRVIVIILLPHKIQTLYLFDIKMLWVSLLYICLYLCIILLFYCHLTHVEWLTTSH